MPDNPIFPRFSDAEYARRYAAVRAEMEKRGLDAIVAAGDSVFRNSNHANVYWLTNWLDPYAAYVVVPLRTDPFLVISNPLYLHHAKRASVIGDVLGVYTPGRTMGERLSDLGLGAGASGSSACGTWRAPRCPMSISATSPPQYPTRRSRTPTR